MSRTFIKICGITRPEDGAAACEAGADAIGLVFWPGSKRAVGIERAKSIVCHLPETVHRVGVFVEPTCEQVMTAADEVGISIAQITGNRGTGDWDYLASHIRLVQSISLAPGSNVNPNLRNASFEDYLVDNALPQSPGGTGETFDWKRVAEIRSWGRIWLAGGLNSLNVGDAIAEVSPYAVDVSSGVEVSSGIKSSERIREFIAAVRIADQAKVNGHNHAR